MQATTTPNSMGCSAVLAGRTNPPRSAIALKSPRGVRKGTRSRYLVRSNPGAKLQDTDQGHHGHAGNRGPEEGDHLAAVPQALGGHQGDPGESHHGDQQPLGVEQLIAGHAVEVHHGKGEQRDDPERPEDRPHGHAGAYHPTAGSQHTEHPHQEQGDAQDQARCPDAPEDTYDQVIGDEQQQPHLHLEQAERAESGVEPADGRTRGRTHGLAC